MNILKIFFTCSLIIIIVGVVYPQTCTVSGATTTIVNGAYQSSNPLTQDGVFYYIKSGSPNLYLYRTERSGIKYWSIGQD